MNNSINYFLIDSFSRRTILGAINNLRRHTLSDNTPFKRFLIAHKDNDGAIEVPILLKDNISMRDCKFPSITLVCNTVNSVEVRRLASTIIRRFSDVSYEDRLICVRTNKGDKYYGCDGLILDKDFNPLLILTIRIKDNKIYPICRISPRAITGQGIMENLIKNKIIPTYCESTTLVNYIPIGYSSYELGSNKVSIIIDNCDYFVTSPTVPRPSLCTDDCFTKFLYDNAESMINES